MLTFGGELGVYKGTGGTSRPLVRWGISFGGAAVILSLLPLIIGGGVDTEGELSGSVLGWGISFGGEAREALSLFLLMIGVDVGEISGPGNIGLGSVGMIGWIVGEFCGRILGRDSAGAGATKPGGFP